MKYYLSKTNDAYFNLAMEEYIMKNIDEQILYLYQNGPSVIIGKNQNPYSEVDVEYLRKNDIQLVRRLSGGGAVYHDLGNLNYAFILPNESKNLYQFKEKSQPIVDVLNNVYNLNVEFSGRNDLIIDERKISGSAQYVVDDRLLHHGTLLYNVDFSNISNILTPNKAKIESKGVKSVQSRVANMIEYFNGDKPTFEDLRIKIIESISDEGEFIFTESQINEIAKIANDNKKSVEFILENKKQYDNQYVEYIPGFGTIEVYSNVLDNKINDFEIFGEYFFKDDLNSVKENIIGITFEKESIENFVNEIENFENLFHRLKKEKLVELILGN